jgi:hypothetical protein
MLRLFQKWQAAAVTVEPVKSWLAKYKDKDKLIVPGDLSGDQRGITMKQFIRGLRRTAVLTAAAATLVTAVTGLAGAASAQTSVMLKLTTPATAVRAALAGHTPVPPAALTGLSGAAPAAHASPHLTTDGSYDHIINDNSGQCLAVPGGSTDAGTGLIQWPCGTWADHYWAAQYQFTDSAGIYWYHIRNLNSGQCLAVPGASTSAGVQVIQWPCGTWADHYWAIVYDSTGKIHIINYNSGQCLAIPGASTAAGTAVIQWPCGTWPDHYWH